MTTFPQLLDALIAAAPEVDALKAEHLRDNDELLPHVLLGRLTDWLVVHQPQPRVLQVLEDAWISGDYNTRDLIAASVVENIESGPDYAALRDALGPNLRQLWNASHA